MNDDDKDDEPRVKEEPIKPGDRRALFAARTRGRELALKYLYQRDLRKGDLGTFDEFVLFEDARGVSVEFARRLVEGVVARQEEIDGRLQKLATNWALHRMAVVDRNVLRIGACEMALSPPGVAINEAVELGKKFGAAQSGKFINGILDKMSRMPGFLAPDAIRED